MKEFICLSFFLLLHCHVLIGQYTQQQINDVVRAAQSDVRRKELTPIADRQARIGAPRTAAAASLFSTRGRRGYTGLDRFNKRNKPIMNRELSIGGQVTQRATLALMRRAPGSMRTIAARSPTTLDPSAPAAGFSAANTMTFSNAAAQTCADTRPVAVCDRRQRYRETDGQCNNLFFRSYPDNAFKLGAAFTAQGRFLYPAYDDGISSPRVRSAVRPELLPNARFVSLNVHSGTAFRSDRHTPFLTHFGQFIDHDIVSTPDAEPNECFNINFEPDDPLQGTCMRFNRADTAPSFFCKPGPRLQQNQRSSFIDGTMIYGFDDEQEAKLREPGTGRLLTGGDNQLKMQPVEDPNDPPCIPVNNRCFEAGDHRSTETVPLTVLHIMFLRRHNDIVEDLRKIQLPWTPELLYQEAKRIVIAELQHITYNEFLPRVLDDRTLNRYRLRPARLFRNSYSRRVDPRTTSSFSVAAYRFGHSLVRNIHNQIGPGVNPEIKNLNLQDHFDRLQTHLDEFPGGNTEGFARWMKLSRKSAADRTLVDGLQNNLFPCNGTDCPMGGGITKAFDLAALNIQRGRDHGLPSYTKWRWFCNRKITMTFKPVAIGLSDHSPFEASILERTYRHVDDIDLFTGAMTEMRRPGALVGPTFACIIGQQFENYKRGDRFFYERPNPVVGFTRGQLRAIKQTSLAKILCSTMRGFIDVQPNLMDRPSRWNRIVNCNVLRSQDILAKLPYLWNRLPPNAIRSATEKAAKFSRIRVPPISGRSRNPIIPRSPILLYLPVMIPIHGGESNYPKWN